jgi:signal transduction histidine kinase
MLDALDDPSRARIRYVEPDSSVFVAVDRLRIERAVLNVVRNALKYSPDSEQVTISTSIDADCATIDVTDRGRGIPRDECERIFDRFYRAGTRGTAEGLGLGLYIAALVVRAHRGRIWVDSEIDRGSTFHIRLLKLVG